MLSFWEPVQEPLHSASDSIFHRGNQWSAVSRVSMSSRRDALCFEVAALRNNAVDFQTCSCYPGNNFPAIMFAPFLQLTTVRIKMFAIEPGRVNIPGVELLWVASCVQSCVAWTFNWVCYWIKVLQTLRRGLVLWLQLYCVVYVVGRCLWSV